MDFMSVKLGLLLHNNKKKNQTVKDWKQSAQENTRTEVGSHNRAVYDSRKGNSQVGHIEIKQK